MCKRVKLKLGKKSKGGVDDNSKRGRKEAKATENVHVPLRRCLSSLSIRHTEKS
jgi:hypothetical protein